MKYFIALFGLVLTFSALADPVRKVDGTKELCQKAADTFGSGKFRESYQILKPYWPLPAEEIDSLAYQTESQMKMVASRFGHILGSDYIGSREAGDSFVQHMFIAKFERHAIRFVCVFYKPKNEWLVNAVYWDDNTMKLFQ